MSINNSNKIHHHHFNNAGDSPSPPQVQNAIVEHMKLESEVGGYRAAELISDKIQHVYDSVARLIGAGNFNMNTLDEKDGEREREKYNSRHEIALVESATVGWTRVFYSMLETKEREYIDLEKLVEGSHDEVKELFILVSEAEYAANLVAAVKYARDRAKISRFRWRVLPIPSSFVRDADDSNSLTSSGVVDLDAFSSMLNGSYNVGVSPGDGGIADEAKYLNPSRIAVVCITHIPTNSGIINPANEIGEIIDNFNKQKAKVQCKKHGSSKLPTILYLVDACQSVGQISVNVHDMKCHALAATGRKYLRGPRGTGFLYVRKDIANELEPSHVDHSAAPVLQTLPYPGSNAPIIWKNSLEEENEFGLTHSYQPGAARFEFWESNIAIKLGLGAAVGVCLSQGMDVIEKSCAMLGDKLRTILRGMNGVKVYHDSEHSVMCGIVTFTVKNWEPATIKEKMENGNSEHCFHLSVVPATSTPLDSSRTKLGEERLIRASVSYFNTEQEIDLFCVALKKLMD